MAQAYRVCAPYVTVRVKTAQGGETVLGFYEGGILPESALEDNVEALLAKGLIEETDAPTPEAQAEVDAKAEEKATKAAEKNAADAKAAEEKKADEAAKKAAAAEKQAKADADKAEKAEAKPATTTTYKSEK